MLFRGKTQVHGKLVHPPARRLWHLQEHVLVQQCPAQASARGALTFLVSHLVECACA